MTALTHKQAELLAFIAEYQQDWNCTPSFEEMKGALGLKSKSGIHRLVDALIERGYIRKLPNRHRAIEIIDNPSLPSAPIPKFNDSLRSIPTAALRAELRLRDSARGTW